MPAVVAPEHDDGVVAVRAVVECVEHAPEHGIGVVDGGEVGLDALFPLAVLLDVREVAVAGDALAFGGHVVEVVFLVSRRELDGFERKGFEILLRDKPRLVWAVDAAGEKEGFFVGALELLADPLRHQPVAAVFLIRDIERGPVGFTVLPRAADAAG